jgi:thiol-disulfide isomerase/thioredoxin
MKLSAPNLKLVWLSLSLIFIAMQAYSGSLPKAGSAFYDISLTTAKQKAAEEDKPIFVEFYANWCVPCKWMEETTFADPMVQKVLKEDYIAVRVDIDDFDGYAVKEHYNIKVLPTILVLDKNGRSIERQEQSLTPEMLLKILIANPEEYEAPVNTSPKSKGVIAGKVQNPAQKRSSEKNTLAVNAAVKTTSYRVQVGVYTDYANTENLVENLREMTDEPIVVLNDYLNNRTVFKILVGDFDDRTAAVNFKNTLWQNYGIDGFVK